MKKRISIILILTMLAALFNIIPAAAEDEQADKKAEAVYALGIIKDNYFSDGGITRGNYARLMMDFLNLEATDSGEDTRFIDVDTSNPAIGAVNALYDMGYIEGYGAYIFKPEQGITYGEAVNIMTAVMGYKDIIKSAVNYYNVAENLGILEGISYSRDEKITENDVLILIFNSLKAKTAYVDSNGDLKLDSGETALEKYHKIKSVRGIVSANVNTGITSASDAVGKGQISVGDMKFYSEKDYSGYLGLDVECYYRSDDSDELMYLETTSRNNIVEFEADDVEKFKQEEISYEIEDKKIKKIKPADDVKVILNGVAYSGYGRLENIDITDASIKALDDNGDLKYDIIFITKCEDYYISRIDLKNEAVYDDLNNTSVELDSSKYTVNVYNEKGEAVKLADLKVDSVISVAVSQNAGGDVIRSVYVSDKTVSGEVSAIRNGKEYVIEGTTYKKSVSCTQKIEMGTNAKFYINKYGKIAARVMSSGEKTLGVVRSVIEDETSSDNIIVKIYTQDGEFVKYNAKKNVKINNISVKVNSVKDLSDSGIISGQPVLFTQKDGFLKTIETPKSTEEGELGEFRLISHGYSFEVLQNIVSGTSAVAEGQTVILSIPKDTSDDEAYSKISFSQYKDQLKSKEYAIYSYGSDKMQTADLIIGYDAAATVLSDESVDLYLVKQIYEGIDSDGLAANMVSIENPKNGESQVVVSDNLDTSLKHGYLSNPKDNITNIQGVELSEIDRGDIIRIAKNSAGKIIRIELIYDYDNPDNERARLEIGKGWVDTCNYYPSKYIAMQRMIYSVLDAATERSIQYKTSFFDGPATGSNDNWKNTENLTYRIEVSGINDDNVVTVYEYETDTSKKIKRSELNNYRGKKFVMTINQNLVQNMVIYE